MVSPRHDSIWITNRSSDRNECGKHETFGNWITYWDGAWNGSGATVHKKAKQEGRQLALEIK